MDEDEERNTRGDDAEYVRTAVICDAQDVYLQQVRVFLFLVASSV